MQALRETPDLGNEKPWPAEDQLRHPFMAQLMRAYGRKGENFRAIIRDLRGDDDLPFGDHLFACEKRVEPYIVVKGVSMTWETLLGFFEFEFGPAGELDLQELDLILSPDLLTGALVKNHSLEAGNARDELIQKNAIKGLKEFEARLSYARKSKSAKAKKALESLTSEEWCSLLERAKSEGKCLPAPDSPAWWRTEKGLEGQAKPRSFRYWPIRLFVQALAEGKIPDFYHLKHFFTLNIADPEIQRLAVASHERSLAERYITDAGGEGDLADPDLVSKMSAFAEGIGAVLADSLQVESEVRHSEENIPGLRQKADPELLAQFGDLPIELLHQAVKGTAPVSSDQAQEVWIHKFTPELETRADFIENAMVPMRLLPSIVRSWALGAHAAHQQRKGTQAVVSRFERLQRVT